MVPKEFLVIINRLMLIMYKVYFYKNFLRFPILS